MSHVPSSHPFSSLMMFFCRGVKGCQIDARHVQCRERLIRRILGNLKRCVRFHVVDDVQAGQSSYIFRLEYRGCLKSVILRYPLAHDYRDAARRDTMCGRRDEAGRRAVGQAGSPAEAKAQPYSLHHNMPCRKLTLSFRQPPSNFQRFINAYWRTPTALTTLHLYCPVDIINHVDHCHSFGPSWHFSRPPHPKGFSSACRRADACVTPRCWYLAERLYLAGSYLTITSDHRVKILTDTL